MASPDQIDQLARTATTVERGSRCAHLAETVTTTDALNLVALFPLNIVAKMFLHRLMRQSFIPPPFNEAGSLIDPGRLHTFLAADLQLFPAGKYRYLTMTPMDLAVLTSNQETRDTYCMSYMALTVLFGVLCSAAEQTPKPPCNVKSQGQLWPSEANSDHNAARTLFQSGELEMCSLAVWKYKWEHLSVNAHDFAKPKHPQPAKPVKLGVVANRPVSRLASPTPMAG